MNEERTKRNRVTWHSTAAVACFVGSVLSLGVGFVFTTGWLLNEQLHPLLHGVGIVLLVVGIPILILGGHFMDLMERKVRRSDKELDIRGAGGPGPLHVVVGVVAFFTVLCVTAGTVNAQQTSAIPSSVPTASNVVGPTVVRATLESRLAPSEDAESNGISNS